MSELLSPMDPIPAIRRFLQAESLSAIAVEALTPESSLLVEGGLDSLGLVRLVAFLEKEFRVRIPPEEVTLDHFETLGAIAQYLAGRQGMATT